VAQRLVSSKLQQLLLLGGGCKTYEEAARRSYRNAIAQLRFPQRQLAGHYPELPDSAEAITRAARYALAALEEAS